MKKILSTDPSSRPYSSFRSAAISSLFTRNHRKMRRDRAIDRHVLIGRQVSEDFSPGGQIIENKIFFIYSLYGDVPQCGHGCGWSSTVPISANGPRAVRAHVPRMHGGKRYRCSYFFADCGRSFVEATICAIFPRRNAFHRPNVCPMTTRHTPFSSTDIMDCIAATRVLHRSRISIRGKTLGSIRKHVDEHILEN